MWDFPSGELALHAGRHISERRRNCVCRMTFQVMKSWFQDITLFPPFVSVQLLQRNGLGDITAPKKPQERKLHPAWFMVHGVGISEGGKRRSWKSGVDVAEPKDFPGSWPLLTQPGHAGETGGFLQGWLTSLFPGYSWVVDLTPPWKSQLLHHFHSGEPEHICLCPFGTSTVTRRTKAQAQIKCIHALEGTVGFSVVTPAQTSTATFVSVAA